MRVKTVTWHKFDRYINDIREQIEKPDCILAIARGGLVPGTVLSHKYNCPLYTIGVTSYSPVEDEFYETQGILKITQDIDSTVLTNHQKILVVDDICDTGKTFTYVKDYLDSLQKQSTFCSIFKRTSSPACFVCAEVITENIWVKFPWE